MPAEEKWCSYSNEQLYKNKIINVNVFFSLNFKPFQGEKSHNVLLCIHRILSSVLPTFDVKIESEKEYILEGDSQLQVTIHAM